MSKPLPEGTMVSFRRRSRDTQGHGREWTEVGVIARVSPFQYVVRTDNGGTYIRRPAEVKEVPQ